MILVRIKPDFEAFRKKARQLIAKKIRFDSVEWVDHEGGFFFGEEWQDIEVKAGFSVSKEFLDLAKLASAYRETSTWSLLYRLLYRITYEDKNLLRQALDPDILELDRRVKLVNRDIHKMKAFVRFREVKTEDGAVYLAWHRPDHRIVRFAAPFFKDRFNGMKWMIMTEDETVSWDKSELFFTEGIPREKVSLEDEAEDLWKTYYRSIFNPARIKIQAMKKELPVRHWSTLPETELITELIAEAPSRLQKFYDSQKERPVTAATTLSALYDDLAKCRACGICERATAPVPGFGPSHSRIMIIGEQPGNEEDLSGKPFVGPAGQVLNEALTKNGIRREDLFLTNAVKGFKYIPKGHQRWHKGASISEITTCRLWLKKEIEMIKPETIICLGRSAAFAIVGKLVKIEDVRGRFFESAYSKQTIIFPHPASVLRDMTDKEKALELFTADFKKLVR